MGIFRTYRLLPYVLSKLWHNRETLTNMTKKGGFQWTSEGEAAFAALKKAMTSTLVLSLLDFTQMFEVHIDASDKGIETVLIQNESHVAYLSKGLGIKKMGVVSLY